MGVNGEMGYLAALTWNQPNTICSALFFWYPKHFSEAKSMTENFLVSRKLGIFSTAKSKHTW